MDQRIENTLSVAFYAFSINDRIYGFQLIYKLYKSYVEKNEFIENSDKYFDYLKKSSNLSIENHFINVLKNSILPVPYYIWLKEYNFELFKKLIHIRNELYFNNY